ncbi:MAG: thermonuclease family protein [Proteobacteria bacterium]|nr:thermonuclease family protein [Pseudomonadota bacterium]
MNHAIIALALILLSAGSALAEMTGPAKAIEGDVIEIGGERLRLFGIDAPEPEQSCTILGNSIDCGHIAKTALMDLTAGATVVCRPTGKKRRGLAVATCSVDGFDISENMVHTGWALADPEDGSRYLAKQQEAKRAKRGLWRGTFTLPWRWRQERDAK